ncbi:hypothetical protein FRB91_004367 [Serendipita sp. 411]|nr:hypothetical protein FRB91_004367 [Serendipita sp. 411]
MTAQLGFSFLSPLSSPSRAASPTHSRPQSLSPSTNRISATPSTALPPATALPPLSGRRFTRRKPTLRRYRIAPAHPPPPPTKGLPPFKFLSDEEMLQLLGEGYIRGMTEGSRVTTGWKQLDATRIGRISRPKGTKGKYIRLISLPPLVVDVPNESIEGTIRGERAKGLQPSIRMELDEETDDGVMDTGANTFVPTIYMTELLASQYDMPVACMMWPPLPTEVVTSALKAHKRPVSEASTTAGAPSHVRHDELIHQPPAKAYQFPIQDLTRVQRTTLQSAKLLVYAVPPQYLGPVPPPELEIVKEEVVAPWANTQFNTASSLAAIVEGNTKPSTPRLSGFPSGALSPRWGPAVEGLWSKSGTDTAKKRVSSASVRSVESSAPNTAKPEGQEATPAEGQTTTSTWSAGLGSLRSRYYASRAATGPPVTTSQLTTSTSDPANVTSPLSTSSVLSPPSATSTASISGSRSFGSFFSRSTSSPATTTITSTLASTSIVQTTSSSSTASQQQQQLKVDEFGFVAGAESGSFVFDGDDLVPKDVTLGVSTTSSPKAETADAVETPSTAQSTGWRGWGARWGRGNQ